MSILLNPYLPVFQLGVDVLLYPQKHGSFATFRQESINRIDNALAELETLSEESEIKQTHFAVVIWLDEIVLRSASNWISEWRNDLLQTRLFNTSIGGSEFFLRLDAIDAGNKHVRQVYLFCLLMGFRGKYVYEDPDLLRQRIEEERSCLPVEWREWPNDSPLVDVDFSINKRHEKITFYGRKRFLVASGLLIWLMVTAMGFYLASGG